MPRPTLKRRPLRRIEGILRDTKLFIIACDDTYAPAQYFENHGSTRVQVHVVPAPENRSAARHVLAALEDIEFENGDERWLLLDTDHMLKPSHLPGFTNTIRKARQKNINVAISRPCFEVWLLLHHRDERFVRGLNTADEFEAALRAALGVYNKTNVRPEDYPMDGVPLACQRAARLDAEVGGGDIPSGTTTRVYRLVESILRSIGSVELHETGAPR
jgi:hypothetical protein